MKRLLLILVLVIFSILFLFLSKQESKPKVEKIHFIEGTLNEVLQNASKENKLVFVDCYTTWCAPCKWMDKFVFVKEDVFTFYNSSFINYKIDMEKGEGSEIAKKYGIRSYPFYLFLNGEGELIHIANSKMSASAFIQEGKNALNPKKSIGNLSKKYVEGNLSNEELIDYVIALKNLRDPRTNEVFGNLMAKTDKDWLKTLYGFHLIENFVYGETSELFSVLNENRAYFVSLVGDEAVNNTYKKVLLGKMNESSRNQDSDFFLKQLDSLKKLTKSPKDIAIVHCNFYLNSDNVEEFVEKSNYYVNTFLSEDAETISYLARSAFFKVKEGNSDFLNQATFLIEKAYLMNPNNYSITATFAEIQSKAGNRVEAIKAAEKAVKMADTISSKVKKRAEKNLIEIERFI